MLALLTGNFVRGFTVFELPTDIALDEAARHLAHVPESRLVEVRSFDDLVEEFGELPEPANTTPKTVAVETPDAADGPGTGGADDAPVGDNGGADDGIAGEDSEPAGEVGGTGGGEDNPPVDGGSQGDGQ